MYKQGDKIKLLPYDRISEHYEDTGSVFGIDKETYIEMQKSVLTVKFERMGNVFVNETFFLLPCCLIDGIVE